MASNTQNDMNYQPGAQYMHALTLATEAAVTRYYHEDVFASAVQVITMLDQGMALAVENVGLAETMLEKAVEQVERLSERGYGGYAQAIGYAVHSKYFIPAGVAEAIVLPELLRSYGAKAEQQIASLASLQYVFLDTWLAAGGQLNSALVNFFHLDTPSCGLPSWHR